ncbi:MAG: SPOR domain-containing protein, partial [Pseudomonadota bacterium]
ITDLNVISSPNLMVLDNQTARLVVGDQIPVTVQNVTNGFTGGDSDPVLFNSIEFRDTGVIFEVTPRISSDGSVTLDLIQEISTVSGPSGASLTPTINQRRIESSVVAQSGQTIVLGGLFSDRDARGRSGIPIVSRAPLLGGLFSNTSTESTRTELVVLIQPRILRNEADARAITREFQDRVTGLQLSGDPAPLPSATPVPSAAPGPVQPAFPAAPATTPDRTQTTAGTTVSAPATVVAQAAPRPVLQQPAQNAPTAQPSPSSSVDIPLQSVLPATPTRNISGSVFLQLGAYETREAAINAVRGLQTGEKLLSGSTLRTDEANGLWRLLAGPFDRAKAQSVCADLERPCAIVQE